MTTAFSLGIDLPRLDAGRPRHALVVEDDADVRGLVAEALSGAGFVVTAAEHGRAALDSIDQEIPDVVVLDVAMPGLSGLDVCRELRSAEATRALPIVMLTARAHVSAEGAGFMAGADLYLTKPFSPKALVARIEHLLTFSR